jgi:hypothetical protein
MVLFTGTGVYLVTGYASWEFESIYYYVPDITQHVSIPCIQVGIVRFGEVHFIVLEKIVARNEVIRIRKPGRPGPPHAQVALSAGRFDRPGILMALF